MNEIIRNDNIRIIEESVNALKQENAIKLKEVSDHTIHNASIFQDEDSITIAVLTYALSKILERGIENRYWFEKKLEFAKIQLIKQNIEFYRKMIKEIFSQIARIDSKLKIYVQEVIEKAKIKKGAKLYYHGISMARTASVLGITQWELMNYIGKLEEPRTATANIKGRISFARKLFKQK
ncbi:MAG: hypothetical protein ACP5OZ_02360 [Candidatus Woesearchaeota archaeon]